MPEVLVKRIIFTAVLCLGATALFAQRVGQKMYVNVQLENLKASAGFFASAVAGGPVRYGDEVTILALSGNYAQVRTTVGNRTGWIAKNSLTTTRITRQGSGSVSDRNIALAGKDFPGPGAEAETEYRRENRALNYAAVDAMERAAVADRDMETFIEQGRLKKGE